MTSTAPPDVVIDARGLRKSYRRGLRHRPPQRALDGLDLCVQAGGRVHGFLGPNGSGKTTTLRTLVRLVRPDAADVWLLGRPVPQSLAGVIDQVGALVEAPQFFRNFSGRRNLTYLADVAAVPRSRVDEALSLVDLHDRADDAVRGYSLGDEVTIVARGRTVVSGPVARTSRMPAGSVAGQHDGGAAVGEPAQQVVDGGCGCGFRQVLAQADAGGRRGR
jgi:ABC-type Na+ transport system ATPase subunit NatA